MTSVGKGSNNSAHACKQYIYFQFFNILAWESLNTLGPNQKWIWKEVGVVQGISKKKPPHVKSNVLKKICRPHNHKLLFS